MTFTIETKNLGRLPEIPIEIGGLTVLAGPNATGKSFLSKVLYSIFSAMNENHALICVQDAIDPMWPAMNELIFLERRQDLKPKVLEFTQHLREIKKTCQPLTRQEDELSELERIHDNLISKVRGALDAYETVLPHIRQLTGNGKKVPPPYDIVLSRTYEGIRKLKDISCSSSEGIAHSGFKLSLEQNVFGNFQVNNFSELKKDAEKDTLIDIANLVKVIISDEALSVDLADQRLTNLRRHSRVIYLESPIFWKLRSGLNAAKDPFSGPGRRVNIDIPKYFYDLDAAIQRRYAGEIAFPKLLEKLTGDKVLGGKIAYNEVEWRFVESNNSSNRSFSLPLAATGTVSLAMIALLIERRLIDEGTFLFIDEPESNLHPKWQVVMIETLIELAKGGVNVVIATHSADIMERLSALAKRNSELERLISLNHFSRDCMKGEDKDKGFHDKIDDILKELTDPYSISYMMRLGLDDD